MEKAGTSIIIRASIQKVWTTLTNLEAYPDWNPFIYKIESSRKVPKPGTKMVFWVRFENGKTSESDEFVTLLSPPDQNMGQSAKWVYRFDGFLHKINMIRATRTQQLTVLEDNTVKYETEEIFLVGERNLYRLTKFKKVLKVRLKL